MDAATRACVLCLFTALHAATVRAQAPSDEAEPQGAADAGAGDAASPEWKPEDLAPAEAPPSEAPPLEAPPSEAPPLEITGALQASQAISSYDPRSTTDSWLIAPDDTVRVGLENTLVTADGDLTPLLATPQLALTDLVLLRLSAGYSVAGKVELFTSVTLLPKQPITTDASVFQGAGAGARVGLASAWALTLAAQGGPTIDADGAWADAALTLDARYRADRFVVFDGNLGVGATAVSPSDELVGLTEVLAAGQVIIQEPKKAAITAGIGFAFPFWSHDSQSLPLDPQTRVHIHATGVLSVADDWDVWLRAAVIDRGELTAPGSVLPILDGGFDQQQFTLGVNYRSEGRDPDFGL